MLTEPRLLISVVDRGKGDMVVDIARGAGATGSTVLFGRSTADNKWLCLLCLADVQKELVFTIAGKDVLAKMEAALRRTQDLRTKRPGLGIMVDVESFMHLGPPDASRPPMAAQRGQEDDMRGECVESGRILICAVVNAGLADDLMAAARKAGAAGGTILRARGTSRDEDRSFFGITIVPEKELLMIMAQRSQEKTLTTAIESCDCLAQPGVGVIFTLPVEKFFQLGRKSGE